MADIHGSPANYAQNPQATSPGSAPVPYQGADQSPEPPDYSAGAGPMGPDGAIAEVIASPPLPAGSSESAVAYDIAAGLADAPYYPGSISPIDAMGDSDAGGRDDVAGDVAAAVHAAEARFLEHQADTFPQGSVIGDLMSFPPNPLDPGVGSLGVTDPSGAFYDPPRGY